MLLGKESPSPKQSPVGKILRNSQILLMQRIPIIKGSVVAYTLDNNSGQLFFKILTFKDTYTMWSVKKTY
jgi:hypothetical protein